MKSRAEKFESLRSDPWYSALMPKLKKNGEAICKEFIEAHGDLPIGEWEFKVQRLFLDRAEKPANWTLINEILIVCGKTK